MVGYRRNFVKGGTFFFTVALANRRSRALVEHADALRNAFRKTDSERPFHIDAIVILPEHLHAMFTLPDGDANFSRRWQRIKALFTSQLRIGGFSMIQDSRGEYLLWQRRFWEHTIRDEKDFARHVDYIHFNPVKHGLVARVRDWPYSSFHRYVREGQVPEDWAGDVTMMTAKGFGEP
jgi:putative transposase